MPDEVVPPDYYSDPYDNPQDQPSPSRDPSRYDSPPRESPPPALQPGSAEKPPGNLPLDPREFVTPTAPNDLTDRITVMIQTHHEQWGDEPLSFGCQFSANTEISDQGYKRKILVPDDKKILLEWGEYPAVPGLLMIANRTGQIQFTRKSPAEITAIQKQNLLISLCEDCPDEKALIVRPGRGFVSEMQDDTEIWLKSASGICEIMVYLFPR